MNTLSNVSTRRGGTNPPYDGLTSNVILEVCSHQKDENSNTGVSSSYVPIENHQWFVLRATYNRVEKDIETLEKSVAYVYLPKRCVISNKNGKKRRILEPLVPNIIFVYSNQENIENLFQTERTLSHLRFYRDKTKEVCHIDGKHPPVVVSFNEMLNFIRLTSVVNEHIRLVEPEHCRYKSGDKVRIIEGDFYGVEGRVARIAGQQRVVVEMQGICMIATAYIPSAFLEKIDKHIIE